MTTVFSFCVEGPPVPKGRPRFCNGKVTTPQVTRDYERVVHTVCSLRRPPNWSADGEFRVGLRIYVKRSTGDLDNYAKSVLDGMQGAAFRNDKMVCGFDELERFIDKLRPRVEVTVRRVG